jgi:transposase InsO family protein
MSWKEASVRSLRKEFVKLASQAGANVRELCRRFGISSRAAYKWMRRYQQHGEAGLEDQSRRPRQSPHRSAPEVEQVVLSVRDQHPAWGARKIGARLEALGQRPIPAASTIHAILKRQGRIDPAESAKHQPWQRFEQEAPNQLWQMDFKGHFALGTGERCHPLSVLDDHSRYALCLAACHNQQAETVQQHLTETFRRYGLPERLLMDNGSPWGDDAQTPYSVLGVWLLRLGIGVSHGRPYHPQTQGKEERFHRTLEAEVLQGRVYADFGRIGQRFDQWRDTYNHERPHEALGMAVPGSRYQISRRPFPEVLPAIEYGPADQVRKVQRTGRISFQNREVRISKAFRGYPVALRPTAQDGLWEVYFCTHKIAQIALKEGQ